MRFLSRKGKGLTKMGQALIYCSEGRKRLMKAMGHHYIAELSKCPAKDLDDKELLHRLALKAAQTAGLTVLGGQFSKCHPQGVAGLLLLAESHFSIHSWPEEGYCAVDLFTCGDSQTARTAVKNFARSIKAGQVIISEIKRGIHRQAPLSHASFHEFVRSAEEEKSGPSLVLADRPTDATVLPFHGREE
jgi:S-adenosylmethionine decarboxylase